MEEKEEGLVSPPTGEANSFRENRERRASTGGPGRRRAVGKVAGEAEEARAGDERRRRAAAAGGAALLPEEDGGGGAGGAAGGGGSSRRAGRGGDAVWCGGPTLRERRQGSGADKGDEDGEEREVGESRRLMARGSGSGRWSRQRVGFLNTMLRCNLPPETQKVVVFLIMMLLIIINVVLMFLLAFQ